MVVTGGDEQKHPMPADVTPHRAVARPCMTMYPQGMSDRKARITVSLDPDVVAGLKAAAEQAGAASVSEYVEGALDARMARERWLGRWRSVAGDPDPDALAYARRSLLGQGADEHPQAS
jgi:Ribbon-helix-helix protein, copG family